MSTTGPLVLGTAGHVDHGKTALVLALTGRDTDRLPEEKARGISIALGFAPLELGGGRTLSLVDVPGHERFVRHMVAGASGIDGYLLCVAADDGVMPQTVEHLAVLRLLGVEDGVVAITKSDLIEPELAAEEVRELVGAEAEIVPVSSVTGAGIDALRAALERLADRLERRTGDGPSRLFVDRVFSVSGAGTVVTGTLWGAPIHTGDHVEVIPGGGVARVRGVQAHDVAVDEAAGGRVALNLVGLERDDAPQGACIVRRDDEWTRSTHLDVRLDWLSTNPRPLRTRRRLQVFLGTSEVPATCVLLEADELAPGAGTLAQLRLESPVPARAGDRLVLRSAERATVAGAVVVDPAPRRHGKGGGVVERLRIIERGDRAELLRLRVTDAGPAGFDPTGWSAADLVEGRAHVITPSIAADADLVEPARERLLQQLSEGELDRAEAARTSGLVGAAALALIDAMVADGTIERDGATVRLVGDEPAADPIVAEVATVLAGAGRQPPGVVELAESLGVDRERLQRALATLRENGSVVAAGELWFDAAAVEEAVAVALQVLSAGPQGIGALRDAWGTGRKHALALAAHLDAIGLTRRVGDERVLRRRAASQ